MLGFMVGSSELGLREENLPIDPLESVFKVWNLPPTVNALELVTGGWKLLYTTTHGHNRNTPMVTNNTNKTTDSVKEKGRVKKRERERERETTRGSLREERERARLSLRDERDNKNK